MQNNNVDMKDLDMNNLPIGKEIIVSGNPGSHPKCFCSVKRLDPDRIQFRAMEDLSSWYDLLGKDSLPQEFLLLPQIIKAMKNIEKKHSLVYDNESVRFNTENQLQHIIILKGTCLKEIRSLREYVSCLFGLQVE